MVCLSMISTAFIHLRDCVIISIERSQTQLLPKVIHKLDYSVNPINTVTQTIGWTAYIGSIV